MLDFNKNQSNEKCPINNNNGGSNSKTPVSRYDSNNNGSPWTTFNNKFNIDGKSIKIFKYKGNGTAAKKKVTMVGDSIVKY